MARGRLGRSTSRARDERGAGIVEFAFVMPVLFLLIFGIIEFGWAFAQHLDVRHGAREGARLAAVNYNPDAETDGALQASDIVRVTCERMDLATGANVSLAATGSREIGDAGQVEVEAPLDTLTGFLDGFFPADPMLRSTVEIRLEQDAEWSDTVEEACP